MLLSDVTHCLVDACLNSYYLSGDVSDLTSQQCLTCSTRQLDMPYDDYKSKSRLRDMSLMAVFQQPTRVLSGQAAAFPGIISSLRSHSSRSFLLCG